jgi:hypothetical protein
MPGNFCRQAPGAASPPAITIDFIEYSSGHRLGTTVASAGSEQLAG